MTEPFTYTDVMIDLETLGVTPDAPILSIGAVWFNPRTGAYDPEGFYVQIDIDHACKGRQITPSTIAWWIGQDEGAKNALLAGKETMLNALLGLVDYIDRPDMMLEGVWGNGSTFDIAMLDNAYTQYEVAAPWMFYNHRDVRTIVSLAPDVRMSVPFDGVPHDALDDAIHQVKYVSKTYKTLGVTTN